METYRHHEGSFIDCLLGSILLLLFGICYSSSCFYHQQTLMMHFRNQFFPVFLCVGPRCVLLKCECRQTAVKEVNISSSPAAAGQKCFQPKGKKHNSSGCSGGMGGGDSVGGWSR